MEEIAFADDFSLYVIERGQPDNGQGFLNLTRHLLQTDNPQVRDTDWGLDRSVQINSVNTRSNYDEELGQYRMRFYATVAFIEPLATGHQIIIAGTSQVR